MLGRWVAGRTQGYIVFLLTYSSLLLEDDQVHLDPQEKKYRKMQSSVGRDGGNAKETGRTDRRTDGREGGRPRCTSVTEGSE